MDPQTAPVDSKTADRVARNKFIGDAILSAQRAAVEYECTSSTIQGRYYSSDLARGVKEHYIDLLDQAIASYDARTRH